MNCRPRPLWAWQQPLCNVPPLSATVLAATLPCHSSPACLLRCCASYLLACSAESERDPNEACPSAAYSWHRFPSWPQPRCAPFAPRRRASSSYASPACLKSTASCGGSCGPTRRPWRQTWPGGCAAEAPPWAAATRHCAACWCSSTWLGTPSFRAMASAKSWWRSRWPLTTA